MSDYSNLTTSSSTDISLDFEDVFKANQNDLPQDLTPGDALLYSLNNLGKVDMSYISKACKRSIKEVAIILRGVIFLDPFKWDENYNLEKGWVTRDEYLSGNLLDKFKLAFQYNHVYKGLFTDNLNALGSVMPIRLDNKNIYVTLGSPWVPTYIIQDFIYDVLRGGRRTVKHDDLTGSWQIEPKWGFGALQTVTYGIGAMNAFHILEKTLNLQPVTIRKEEFDYLGKKKRLVDDEDTAVAVEKQKLLIKTFQDWVWKNPERKQELEEIYYETYGCYRKRSFDGSFLSFPNMNKDISLYDYQKNAVARILFSRNTLLAHDVGSGKTYEMIAAGMELKRTGLGKKIMYVVPNNIISQWEKIFLHMYPTASLLVVNNRNFRPNNRNKTLRMMRDNDYDGIIIDYSSFEMIKLSFNYYIKAHQQYRQMLSQSNYDTTKNTPTVSRKLGYIYKNWEKEFEKLRQEYQDMNVDVFFEDLNIDHLFVDEAHNFKNVPFDTKSRHVLGINPSGSDRAQEMMEKVHYIQSTHNGGGIVFATGTPITNSVSDAYVMQKYLQDGELQLMNIASFDAWSQMFAELSTDFEIDVTANQYRMVSRFSKFHNIPELSTIMSSIVDYYHLDKDKDLPDFNGYKDVLVPHNSSFEAYLNILSNRADDIRKCHPQTIITSQGETRDNMLLITTEGRKAALDMRLISSSFAFDPKGKVYECAKNILHIYHKYNANKATQLVFCDTSTPHKGFNIYDELKWHLTSMGIKEDEIAYIHDATSNASKNALFKKVNKGDIRIVIGSTFKLGTGVNIQERLIAVHHIDVPWRPSDMVQREGRILRPGNTNKEVFIYRYITENSFDAYSWQLLEIKQNFISKLLGADIHTREVSEIDSTVLNYAEVKALAIGNPLIKERVETFNEIQRLKGLRSKFYQAKDKLRSDIVMMQGNLLNHEERKSKALLDKNFVSLSKPQKLTPEEKRELGKSVQKGVFTSRIERTEKELFTYRGFKVKTSPYYLNNEAYIYLERSGKYRIDIKESNIGIVARMDNFIDGLDKYIEEIDEWIKKDKDFIENGNETLLEDDPYLDQINDLTIKLVKINKKLGVKEA